MHASKLAGGCSNSQCSERLCAACITQMPAFGMKESATCYMLHVKCPMCKVGEHRQDLRCASVSKAAVLGLLMCVKGAPKAEPNIRELGRRCDNGDCNGGRAWATDESAAHDPDLMFCSLHCANERMDKICFDWLNSPESP